MKNKGKSQKGITLIALVVTIILMLILAGVSINFLIGENGLIARVTDSKEKAQIERYKEIIELDRTGPEIEAGIRGLDDKSYMDKYQETLEQEALEGNLKGSTITRKDDETVRVVTKEGYVYDATREGTKYLGKQGEEDKNLPEINDGNIKFSYEPSGWTNTEVKVTIETVDVNIDGYYLQYSIDAITWKNYEKGFKVADNNTTIYARVVNGLDEHKGQATGNVLNIDKEIPIINEELTATGSKTSSVTLSTTITDELSGLSKIIWYYKEETESEYEHIEEEYTLMNGKDAGITTQEKKTKEITGLLAGKTYNMYAEVYDVAGNMIRTPKGTETISRKTTGMTETEIGKITITPDDTNWTNGWTNQDVTFTITTTADEKIYKIQYTTNPNGKWTDYDANSTTKPTLTANGIMYARLVERTQEKNTSEYATSTITNIDKLVPNLPTFTETHDDTSITITITATDQEAKNNYEKSDIGLYYFSTDNGASYVPATGQTGKTKTINVSLGTYKLKVKVQDKAGNIKESTQNTIVAVGVGPNGKALPRTVTQTAHETVKGEDSLGNPVTIPGGFKFAGNDDDTVQDGIIIADDEGNEFVWIPVSNIDGDNNADTNPKATDLIILESGEKVEITLGRYTFKREGNSSTGYTDGTPTTPKQLGANQSQSTKIGSSFYEDTSTGGRPNGGEGAKNLAEFITSVEENHGYYLARYEASFGSETAPKNSYSGTVEKIMTNQKPCSKPSTSYSKDAMSYKAGTLWNKITQGDASKVSQNMYSEGDSEAEYVESDLVNSYAWDTAIVYIQAMGNANYANANRGTNTSLLNTGKTGDVKCNIYDMAGNLIELTTEYSTNTSSSLKYPCVSRGGSCNSSGDYTASRNGYSSTNSYSGVIGFRPLLYIVK